MRPSVPTREEVQAIMRLSTGRPKLWLEGSAGHWYLTEDRDDNTSGTTVEKLEEFLQQLTASTGVILFPDWIEPDRRLEILGRCAVPGRLIRIEVPEAMLPEEREMIAQDEARETQGSDESEASEDPAQGVGGSLQISENKALAVSVTGPGSENVTGITYDGKPVLEER